MPRIIVFALKSVSIIFIPIGIIGLVVSSKEISGNQYVAVLEILGTASSPGAIKIFGADVQSVSALLDFLQAWSFPVLLAVGVLGLVGLIFSKDKLKATRQISLGLFFSFGIWAILLTRGSQAFNELLGSAISDLSAFVIATFLAELSAELLNLTGLLALLFGTLALVTWFIGKRRKVRVN
jgi:hypothetical protein